MNVRRRKPTIRNGLAVPSTLRAHCDACVIVVTVERLTTESARAEAWFVSELRPVQCPACGAALRAEHGACKHAAAMDLTTVHPPLELKRLTTRWCRSCGALQIGDAPWSNPGQETAP
jgi:hypothetical protein